MVTTTSAMDNCGDQQQVEIPAITGMADRRAKPSCRESLSQILCPTDFSDGAAANDLKTADSESRAVANTR